MPLSSSYTINKNHASVHLQCRKNANAMLMETHIKDAMSPNWQGHRATRWLKLWDGGNRKTREYLLCAFVELHHTSPISVVDADLGPAAPLWFTRITSYLQISYKRLATKSNNNIHSSKELNTSTLSTTSQLQHISKVVNVKLVANKGQSINTSAFTSPDAFAFNHFATNLNDDKITMKEDARVTRTGIVVQRQLTQPTNNKTKSNERKAGKHSKSQIKEKKSLRSLNNKKEDNDLSNKNNIYEHKDDQNGDKKEEGKEKNINGNLEERHYEESELTELESTVVKEEYETTDSILSLLISSITIFIRGANYLTQFMEAGGAATLMDCLESGTSKWQVQFSPVSSTSLETSQSLLLLHSTSEKVFTVQLAREPTKFQQLTTHERYAVIRLLLFIVNAGRVYREMITNMIETTNEEGLLSSSPSHALSHENTNLETQMNEMTLGTPKFHFESLEEMPSHLLCLLHVFERESDGDVAALMAELFIALIHGHHYNTVVSQCITTALLRIILRHAVMEYIIAKETSKVNEHCNHNDDTHASMTNMASDVQKQSVKRIDTTLAEREYDIDEQKTIKAGNVITKDVHKSTTLIESAMTQIKVHFIYEEVIVQATRVLRAVQLLQEAEYVKCKVAMRNTIKVQDNLRTDLHVSRHVVECNAISQKKFCGDDNNNNNNINGSINRTRNNSQSESNSTSVYDTVPVVGLFSALEDNNENIKGSSGNSGNNIDKEELQETVKTSANSTRINVSAEMTSVDDEELLLFTHLTLNEYLEALLHLAFNLRSTRLRVEGTELITLLTKNISLLLPTINKCVDVLDDDEHEIRDRDNVEQLRQRQRKQIFAGRTLVQMMRSTLMSTRRAELMFGTIAVRSAHFSLLKYLCMADATDTFAVHEVCEVIKWLANTAHRIEMQSLRHTCKNYVNSNSNSNKLTSDKEKVMNRNVQAENSSNKEYLCKVGWDICHVLGKSLFDLLINDAANFDVENNKNGDNSNNGKGDAGLSDEECFAMMRATRAGLASQMETNEFKKQLKKLEVIVL